MKKIFSPVALFILSASLCSVTCQKATNKAAPLKDAVLTGLDQRACPCCGGLMITFSDETKAYAAPFFLVENDPTSLGIDVNTSFPIRVKVAYEQLQKCNQAFIKIKTLKRL